MRVCVVWSLASMASASASMVARWRSAISSTPALVLDPPEVELVGAVGDVERGHREHGQPDARRGERPRRQGRRAGADEVARRAPEEVVVPHPEQRLPRGEGDGDGDGHRVQHEVGRGGGDQRARQAGDGRRQRARHPARETVGQSGRLHRDGEARHAERRAMRRAGRRRAQGALAPGAGDGNQHRLVGAEEQQGREVHGVGHRQARPAPGQGQVDLERRHQRRDAEQGDEEARLRESGPRAVPRDQRRAGRDDGRHVNAGRDGKVSHALGRVRRRLGTVGRTRTSSI